MKREETETGLVRSVKSEELDDYLKKYPMRIYSDSGSFKQFFRKNRGGLRPFGCFDHQDDRAYEMMTAEKNDKDRDALICICISMRMSIDEMQNALMLKGFSNLSDNYLRDLIIMVEVNNQIYSIQTINMVLTKYHMKTLRISGGK